MPEDMLRDNNISDISAASASAIAQSQRAQWTPGPHCGSPINCGLQAGSCDNSRLHPRIMNLVLHILIAAPNCSVLTTSAGKQCSTGCVPINGCHNV